MGIDPRFEGDIDHVESCCVCTTCPTYIEGAEAAHWCINVQKSNVIKDEVDCHCHRCEFYVEQGFHHEFYCTRGNEFGQGGTQE